MKKIYLMCVMLILILIGCKKNEVTFDKLYEESKKDLNLYWRGSSNQRIIDVKRSLKEKKVVILQ